MNKNSIISVKIDSEQSKKFEVKVRVHQAQSLALFCFTVVMDDATKEVRETGMKEILYVDDLLRLENSWEKVEMRYASLKKSMTKKVLKVNLKEAKVFCTGKRTASMETSTFPCSVDRKGMGSNSILLCIKCNG